MKLEFSDQNILQAGLTAVNKGQLYKAICLFARVNSYESMLNQLACFCFMGENGYATDLYRKILAEHFQTRHVMFDALQFGEFMDTVVYYCERDNDVPTRRSAKKHAPNASLLATFLPKTDEDFGPAPDLDYVSDSALWDDAKFSSTAFHDVTSTDYLDSIRINMEKCYFYDDVKGYKKYAKQLLELDTFHRPTVEAQISLCLFKETHKKGLKYALRLAEVDDATPAGIGGAIEIVANAGTSKHNDALAKLLNKALNYGDQMQPYDLEDFVYLATSRLRNTALASAFADLWAQNAEPTSIQGFKVCAIAYFNNGQWQKAREMTINWLNAVPWDGNAKVFLHYVNTHGNQDGDVFLEISNRVSRHYCLPSRVVLFAQNQLLERLDKNKLKLAKDNYNSMHVLFTFCKFCVLEGNEKAFLQTVSLLRAVVRVAMPTDVADFVNFAKVEISSVITDAVAVEPFLARLMEFQCQADLVISLRTGYYVLPVGEFTQVDVMCAEVFAVCASLVALQDGKVFEQIYRNVKDVLQQDEQLLYDFRSVAYVVLCKLNAKFHQSMEAEIFTDEDKALWYKISHKLN